MAAAILAFDTSFDACSVALRIDGQIICEQRSEPRAHARILLPLIDSVLARAARRLQDMDAIAFAQGPGSFTGVRMAASVAQGLAFGAQLPVLAVSSLASLAQGVVDVAAGRLIVPVVDARMGEVYAGYYAAEGGVVSAQHADSLLAPHAAAEILASHFARRTVYALGNAWPLPSFDAIQSEQHQSGMQISAADLLVLAEEAWERGEASPAEHALPVYLRGRSAWKKMSVAPVGR